MRSLIGVDVFEMARMENALEENNPLYFSTVFTPGEQAEAQKHTSPTAYYAARFALKEAAFKALHTSWAEDMEWTQIATRGSESEAPEVVYEGAMQKVAAEMGVAHVSASVSYDGGMAFAAVVLTVGGK